MRRLLLISLDWTRPKDPPLSLGHASIVTHMKRLGRDVVPGSWSVTNPDFRTDDVLQFIMEHTQSHTDIGFGAFVWNEAYILEVISRLRQSQFPGRIILGGPQISYTKKNLESYYPGADIFVRGYAEQALAELYQAKELSPPIAGIHYAGEPDLAISAVSNIEELDSPYLSGTLKPQKFLRWETQRGCPFRCAFCQHRESDTSLVSRVFNKDRVMQEISYFLDNSQIQDIAILDPVFNTGPNYLSILRRFSEGGYEGKLALQCRLEMVKSEFLNLVDAINKTGEVVLEFGLQTIHRKEERHIQRPNNISKVREVFEQTHLRGISTEVSLIFGLPEQTVDTFQQSIDFCKSMQVPTIYAYPLRLHRGTPLYEKKNLLGLIESEYNSLQDNGELIGHVIASPSFSEEDWQRMADIALMLDDYNARREPKMSKTLKNTLWNSGGANEYLASTL